MSKTVLLMDSMEKIDDAYVTEYFATKQKAAKRWLTPRRAHMLAACLCVLLVAGNLLSYLTTFKRISFGNGEGTWLGPDGKFVYTNEYTQVMMDADDPFPNTIPIYRISRHFITVTEIQKIREAFDSPYFEIDVDYNELHVQVVPDKETYRNKMDWTEEELEKNAWDVFEKLSFLDGTYEYMGIVSERSRLDSSSPDYYTIGLGVSFRLHLDGVRVLGDHRCILYFDSSGLVEFSLELYDYQEIGTMEVIPMETTAKRITDPDRFFLSGNDPCENRCVFQIMQVEKVIPILMNQYSDDCKILQPIHAFVGTATDEKDAEYEFNSWVIAIPDRYTHD